MERIYINRGLYKKFEQKYLPNIHRNPFKENRNEYFPGQTEVLRELNSHLSLGPGDLVISSVTDTEMGPGIQIDIRPELFKDNKTSVSRNSKIYSDQWLGKVRYFPIKDWFAPILNSTELRWLALDGPKGVKQHLILSVDIQALIKSKDYKVDHVILSGALEWWQLKLGGGNPPGKRVLS